MSRMFEKNTFKDKVVVVSGGSRGIGRAIVNQFAALGATVSFFYLSNAEAAQTVEAEVEQQGGIARAYQVDVRDKARCEEVIKDICDEFDRIDILVNNSGVVRDNLLVGLSDADIRDVIDTNIIGVFNVCQAAVPYMMRKRSGSIINLSSVSGEKGGRGQTNYAASKGAINALTKSLAVELAKRNIRVNAVAPGVIETDMSKSVRDLAEQEILNNILLRRFGHAEEVANLVTFLGSDMASYITGEVISVDGGFKMG
jgi:3-oxoacyl-[acyl-carrier protein] reductase